MSYQLVLIRHGQSVWNEKNLFTGWHDCALSDVGIAEARAAGQHLHALGLRFDLCYTSVLMRAQKTLDLVLEEMGQELPIIADKALNERDYGDLTGLNKDDARKKFGTDQIHQWRRSYDIAPPGGESLKMTAERVLPYYKSQILPALLSPKRILISAHGNSLRALIMFIEDLSEQQIINRELATGLPIIYQLDEQGRASGAEKPA